MANMTQEKLQDKPRIHRFILSETFKKWKEEKGLQYQHPLMSHPEMITYTFCDGSQLTIRYGKKVKSQEENEPKMQVVYYRDVAKSMNSWTDRDPDNPDYEIEFI